MGLAVVVLVGALAVGYASGGRLRGLADLPLHRPLLVLAATVAQVLGVALAATDGGGRTAYAAGLALSALLAAAFLALNRALPGVPLVAAGLLLNAVVVAANGAMPVSIVAAARAGAPTLAIADGSDPRHDLAGTGTRLRALGDVLPVPLPVRPEVVSAGDVLVVAGVGLLVVSGMRRRDVMGGTADAAT